MPLPGERDMNRRNTDCSKLVQMRQAIAAMGTATLFRAADSCVLVLGVLLVSVGGASPEIAWGESTILELREEYYQATEDSDIADTFYEKMEAIPETATPLQLGYKGLAALVQAKHSFNPINKMRYFSEGRELLDGAIVKDPTSVELHFLRYTVQDNAPFFLDYHEEMEKDRAIVDAFLADAALTAAEPDLTRRILKYLKEHDDEEDEE